MNFRNVLWKYHSLPDGTCAVKIYVYGKGGKKYYPVGIRVKPEDWDEQYGRVKKSHPMCKAYNSKIRHFRSKVEEHFLAGGSFESFESSEKITSRNSLIEFGRKFLREVERGLHPIRSSTARNYKALVNRLDQYCTKKRIKTVYFTDVDIDFYHAFSAFLEEYGGCSLVGIGKNWKNLKRLMVLAQERKLHNNEAYKRFKVHRRHGSDKIYLTADEIESLEKLDLSHNPSLEKERDRFLVAFYFLLRFVDVVRIQRGNIFRKGGRYFLRIRHQKTSQEVIVPAKEKALHLLDKYKYQFDFSSNQQANRHLKNVAAMAGINEVVNIGEKTMPKNQLVTTHTARRTAATLLYLEGASLRSIADLGGWQDIETLKLYLRASGMDTALMASDMDFFQ